MKRTDRCTPKATCQSAAGDGAHPATTSGVLFWKLLEFFCAAIVVVRQVSPRRFSKELEVEVCRLPIQGKAVCVHTRRSKAELDAAPTIFDTGCADHADSSSQRVDTTTAIRQDTNMKYSTVTDVDARNETAPGQMNQRIMVGVAAVDVFAFGSTCRRPYCIFPVIKDRAQYPVHRISTADNASQGLPRLLPLLGTSRVRILGSSRRPRPVGQMTPAPASVVNAEGTPQKGRAPEACGGVATRPAPISKTLREKPDGAQSAGEGTIDDSTQAEVLKHMERCDL